MKTRRVPKFEKRDRESERRQEVRRAREEAKQKKAEKAAATLTESTVS